MQQSNSKLLCVTKQHSLAVGVRLRFQTFRKEELNEKTTKTADFWGTTVLQELQGATGLWVSAAQHINFISPQNAEYGDPKIRNRDGPGNSGKSRFFVEFPTETLNSG